MIKIVDFTSDHAEAAREIARQNYAEARQKTPALPDAEIPSLLEFAGNGMGVAAFDGERLVGYLLGCDPWDGAFGSAARGTFSPLHANGALGGARGKIYMRLYQAAAEKWVARGVGYHAICLYAHDLAVRDAMFTYGFGLRCVDAIRPAAKIECRPRDDVRFLRLPDSRRGEVIPLRLKLSEHMGESPTFMRTASEEAISHAERAGARAESVFAACSADKPVAFLDLSESGETFASEAPGVRNITGAFCLPEHRGGDLFLNLVNFAIAHCAERGVSAVGVDYEGFNPTGTAFWGRHFTPYTMSVTRRIDECGLKP